MTSEESLLISKRFEELWPKADKWDIRLVGKTTRNQSYAAVCDALERLRGGENSRYVPSADKVSTVAREIQTERFTQAGDQDQESCTYCMGSGGEKVVLYLLPRDERLQFDPGSYLEGKRNILLRPEVAREHKVEWTPAWYPCPRCWPGERPQGMRFMDHLEKLRGFYEEWRVFCRAQTHKDEQILGGAEGGP